MKNEETPIIDGDLSNQVKTEDSFWQLEDSKYLNIILTKLDKKGIWWSHVLEGNFI
jgi:hypothetical protein